MALGFHPEKFQGFSFGLCSYFNFLFLVEVKNVNFLFDGWVISISTLKVIYEKRSAKNLDFVWIPKYEIERIHKDEWNVNGMTKSESQSSGNSRSFNIIVDVLLFDWFFDDFPGAEWDVSWGVEISRLWLKGSESGSGGLDLSQLNINKQLLWHLFRCRRHWRFCRRKGWH